MTATPPSPPATPTALSSRRRKWWRIASWVMCSTFALLLITLSIGAWWLWGWQWKGELNFHDSWTDEERRALTDFDHYLRHDMLAHTIAAAEGLAMVAEEVTDSLSKAATEALEKDIELQSELPSPGLEVKFLTAVAARLHIAPLCEALREVAASGKGEPATPTTTSIFNNHTPAITAALCGRTGALRALVEHGADVNARMQLSHARDDNGNKAGDSPLTPFLAGNFLDPNLTVPWEERREIAEYLLSKGADLNIDFVRICCHIALMKGEPEVWNWVLEKGYKPSVKEFDQLLHIGKTAPHQLLEDMLTSNSTLVHDRSDEATVLQYIARKIVYAGAEEMQALEKLLTKALELGANPTLRPTAAENEDTENNYDVETRLPLDILLNKQNFERCDKMPENGCCGDGDDARIIWERMCNMVRHAAIRANLDAGVYRPEEQEIPADDEATNQEDEPMEDEETNSEPEDEPLENEETDDFEAPEIEID
ncbi:MAG: hypothetical protein Q4F35_02285 [Akkermansia sp.]|nr:hypothetical protein [Akkermansia sp.]